MIVRFRYAVTMFCLTQKPKLSLNSKLTPKYSNQHKSNHFNQKIKPQIIKKIDPKLQHNSNNNFSNSRQVRASFWDKILYLKVGRVCYDDIESKIKWVFQSSNFGNNKNIFNFKIEKRWLKMVQKEEVLVIDEWNSLNNKLAVKEILIQSKNDKFCWIIFKSHRNFVFLVFTAKKKIKTEIGLIKKKLESFINIQNRVEDQFANLAKNQFQRYYYFKNRDAQISNEKIDLTRLSRFVRNFAKQDLSSNKENQTPNYSNNIATKSPNFSKHGKPIFHYKTQFPIVRSLPTLISNKTEKNNSRMKSENSKKPESHNLHSIQIANKKKIINKQNQKISDFSQNYDSFLRDLTESIRISTLDSPLSKHFPKEGRVYSKSAPVSPVEIIKEEKTQVADLFEAKIRNKNVSECSITLQNFEKVEKYRTSNTQHKEKGILEYNQELGRFDQIQIIFDGNKQKKRRKEIKCFDGFSSPNFEIKDSKREKKQKNNFQSTSSKLETIFVGGAIFLMFMMGLFYVSEIFKFN